MLSSRLAAVAALLAGSAALALPGAASANTVDHVIWHNKSCQDHQRMDFTIHQGNQRVRLWVHHDWYTAGKLMVEGNGLDWSFRQPDNWIVGHFHVETPPLPKGTYSAEMFSGSNTALHDGYCRSTLEVLQPGH